MDRINSRLAGNKLAGLSAYSPLQVAALAIAGLALFYAIWLLPYYADFQNYFYRAAQTPLDPYQIKHFFNAPWLAWLLWPLSFLPLHLSGAIWVTTSILVSAWCIRRLGGKSLAIALALTSPPFIRFITAGEVDAVPLLGLTLLLTCDHPELKGLGLVFLGAKPQVLSAGALVHWLHLDHRSKWRILVMPVGVLLLSFILNGFWLLKIQFELANYVVNVGLWPYGIPVGLGLLAWSARRNRPKVGALSTFFLVPYVSASSVFAYLSVLFAVAPAWLSLALYTILWAFAYLTY